MHDEKTTRGYLLPHKDNELAVDVERLRETISAIDTDIDALQSGLIKPAEATTTTAGIVKLAEIPTDDEQ